MRCRFYLPVVVLMFGCQQSPPPRTTMATNRLDISAGFPLEKPQVFVPWGIPEKKLSELLGRFGLKKITAGYYVISCVSLGGMHHELGFHFSKARGLLNELEFFHKNHTKDDSFYFNEFQTHFESYFGTPAGQGHLTAGFPSYTWDLKGTRITHYMWDHFGLEEWLRIVKTG